MSAPVALIDYGAGNLASVRKALAAVRADVVTPAAPGDLAALRGGHRPGRRALRRRRGRWARSGGSAIRAQVEAGRPLLGICLGLQWLFEGSEEAPGVAGLGLMAGHCFLLGARSPDTEQHGRH